VPLGKSSVYHNIVSSGCDALIVTHVCWIRRVYIVVHKAVGPEKLRAGKEHSTAVPSIMPTDIMGFCVIIYHFTLLIYTVGWKT
jgi:hypothetical protein